MEEFLKIGVITKPHGLKGEVKVFPTTDVERFEVLKRVYLETGKNGKLPLKVAYTKYLKNQVVVKFEEFRDINEVEKYKGCELWVSREDAQDLDEGEHYIADLIGMKVFLEDGSLFGELTDVMETGANDVYVVERVTGEEALIPAIEDCILAVDVEEGKMVIHLLKGLIDE